MQYPYNLSEIDDGFIKKIISGEIYESNTIDFKQKEYPLSTREDKKKFLTDIVGMLNSNGGVIFLGINDDGEVVGLDNFNYDPYRVQLQQIIESGVESQVIGIQFKKIIFETKYIIAIIVPEGGDKPYCIKFPGQHSMDFVIRQDGSNQPLRLDQLKRMIFLTTSVDNTSSDWDAWKNNKLNEVLDKDWILTTQSSKCILILMNPVRSKPSDNVVDTVKINEVVKDNMLLMPPSSSGFTIVPFYEGVYTFGREKGDYGVGNPCYSFVSVFNNGAIELYDSVYFSYLEKDKEIPQAFDSYLFKYINRFVEILKRLNFVDIEYCVRVYFVGGKQFKVKPSFPMIGATTNSQGIPSDIFEFSCNIITGRDVALELRPLLDKVWQSSGFTRCLRYDEKGAFVSGMHEE